MEERGASTVDSVGKQGGRRYEKIDGKTDA